MSKSDSEESRSRRETAVGVPPWVSASDEPVDERHGAERLRSALERSMPRHRAIASGDKLGRFTLQELLGAGGMGRVFRACDDNSGDVVAVKVLSEQLVTNTAALQRFQKEARLLADVDSPDVTRMMDVCEDDGVHFLVVEYVGGRSLAGVLEERGPLDEHSALTIASHIARALTAMHSHGIIHRDIKPENILLAMTDKARADVSDRRQPLTFEAVKLTDFGLARHVEQTRSLALTRADALLGTPCYMAPEQFSGGGGVDTRSDLYSLGATLFHTLAGRRPFESDDVVQIAEMHRHATAPSLRSLNPQLSDAVTGIVARALEKQPEQRYADAQQMLDDLQRLLRGEATSVTTHPLLPLRGAGPRQYYSFTWDLQSPPEQLWPFVSHTDRLNRAIGLPSVDYTIEKGDHNEVRQRAEVRFGGMRLVWREHAYEWVEGRRLGILREFTSGPLKWFTSVVELAERAGGGTTLTHSFDVGTKGLFSRMFGYLQIAVMSRRSLDRVYRRIDSVLNRPAQRDSLVDPFEPPASPGRAQERRLKQITEQLGTRRLNPAVLLKLTDYVRTAPPQELARIRPLVLAERLQEAADDVTDVCLYGVRDGLFKLWWDVICPVCRIASDTVDTLQELKAHRHCEACNLDYDVDFAHAVEMIFRAHPQVRHTDSGKFCIGSPGHSPHVAAQIRVAAHETAELGLAFREGDYEVRGPQLPHRRAIRVRAHEAPTRLHMDLDGKADWTQPATLSHGHQVLSLANTCDHELVVRVEQTAFRDEGLTAARAQANPLFRELFPTEALSPEHLASVTHMTFLATAADFGDELAQRFGELESCRLLQVHFRRLHESTTAAGGLWLKTLESGALIAFTDPVSAVKVALSLLDTVPKVDDQPAWQPRAAVHSGTVFLAGIASQTEYFGEPVRTVTKLPEAAQPSSVLVTTPVFTNPVVNPLLVARAVRESTHPVQANGTDAELYQVQLTPPG